MTKTLKAVLLFGSLLGLSVGSGAQAVEVKKEKSVAVAKKSSSAQGKTTTARKEPAGKTAKSTTSQRTAASKKAAPRQEVAKKPAAPAAPRQAARKPVHKVMATGDLDPRRLALYSASALVIDQSNGQPLLEKNSDAVVPIASISKLMTAMVVLDAKLDMNEVINIGDEDVDTLKGSRSRLPVGTTMTRETAMLLALMSSENRAAHALGRHYPGGLSAFVQAMNRKAQSLGMSNSHFEEPTGLSSNNVSTAHDLARMVAAAARYPEIRNFSTTAEAKVELKGRLHDFNNTNALVRNDNWEIGVSKTGYISEAGRCLVMQARVADKPVVIVLLDSVGKMTRVGDAQRIKRWMESAGLTPEHRRA